MFISQATRDGRFPLLSWSSLPGVTPGRASPTGHIASPTGPPCTITIAGNPLHPGAPNQPEARLLILESVLRVEGQPGFQDFRQSCWLQGTDPILRLGNSTPHTQLPKHSVMTVSRDGNPAHHCSDASHSFLITMMSNMKNTGAQSGKPGEARMNVLLCPPFRDVWAWGGVGPYVLI